MIVLGVDPGLSKTGWGIINFKKNKCKYIDHGIIKSNAKEPINARILNIKNNIEKVIMIYKPQFVVVEEVFVNIKNPRSALKLGMARGSVLIPIAECKVSFLEYSATFIKKCLTGEGHADKSLVTEYVKKHLHFTFDRNIPEDSYDALAGAIVFCISELNYSYDF